MQMQPQACPRCTTHSATHLWHREVPQPHDAGRCEGAAVERGVAPGQQVRVVAPCVLKAGSLLWVIMVLSSCGYIWLAAGVEGLKVGEVKRDVYGRAVDNPYYFRDMCISVLLQRGSIGFMVNPETSNALSPRGPRAPAARAS